MNESKVEDVRYVYENAMEIMPTSFEIGDTFEISVKIYSRLGNGNPTYF